MVELERVHKNFETVFSGKIEQKIVVFFQGLKQLCSLLRGKFMLTKFRLLFSRFFSL